MAVQTIIQPPRTMLEVYNSLPEGTNVQLIENNLVMSPAPLDIHQAYFDFLYPVISMHVRKTKFGITRAAPYDVRLDHENVYQPDICVISKEHADRVRRNGLYGAPDFVVEILSSGTSRYDLKEKKAAYERFGVTEYWIIDPEENIAAGYYLVNDEYHEFFKEKGMLESKLLNLKIEF